MGNNRLREAEDAYKIGLKKSTRAVDRLKNRYREFQDRVASGTTLKQSSEHKKDKAKDVSCPANNVHLILTQFAAEEYTWRKPIPRSSKELPGEFILWKHDQEC